MDNQLPEELKKGKLYKIPKMEYHRLIKGTDKLVLKNMGRNEMSKHGQPMSQTLAEMQMNELKMNDPKLNKIFDKLKKGDKIKLKTSSTMSRGSDFVEYIVKSKNVVNKGRVEKITLATVGNEGAVKKFLYRRDGKVTFAMGDMAASIDDIKEKYSLINHEIVEEIEAEEVELDEAKFSDDMINKLKKAYEPMKGKKINPTPLMKIFDKIDSNKDGLEQLYKADIPFVSMMAMSRLMLKHNYKAADINKLGKIRREDFVEEVELDEMNMTHVLINMQGKVQGYTSNEKDAKEMARRTKSTIHPIKKKISDKTLDKMNALAKATKRITRLRYY